MVEQQTNEDLVTTIALVAPTWLQDALVVLLDGTAGLLLVASATNVDSLTMLELDAPPDFVLLDADRINLMAVSEVERIIRTWPKTDCVALVDNTGQIPLLKEAGASLSLLKGATPQRLKEVLQALSEPRLENEYPAQSHSPRL
jgi:AmiR/NasT family two-component response regulator